MLITENTMGLGTRRHSIGRVMSLGPSTAKIIGVVLLAMVALFYLAQTTQGATRSYTVQDLETKKQEIQAAKDDLQLEAVRLNSLQTIKTKAEEMGLEPE
jgi:cell division protein FtsL